jgi:hypothetical protein
MDQPARAPANRFSTQNSHPRYRLGSLITLAFSQMLCPC